MVTKESLAQALKSYRFQKEWTLKKMADATGLDISTIQRLEQAKRRCHELTLHKLMKRLPGFLDGQRCADCDSAN